MTRVEVRHQTGCLAMTNPDWGKSLLTTSACSTCELGLWFQDTFLFLVRTQTGTGHQR